MRATSGGHLDGEHDDVNIFVPTAQAPTVIIAPTDAAHANNLPSSYAAARIHTCPPTGASCPASARFASALTFSPASNVPAFDLSTATAVPSPSISAVLPTDPATASATTAASAAAGEPCTAPTCAAAAEGVPVVDTKAVPAASITRAAGPLAASSPADCTASADGSGPRSRNHRFNRRHRPRHRQWHRNLDRRRLPAPPGERLLRVRRSRRAVRRPGLQQRTRQPDVQGSVEPAAAG